MTTAAFPSPRTPPAATGGVRRMAGFVVMLLSGAAFGVGLGWLAGDFQPPAELVRLLGADHWSLLTLLAIPVLWLLAVAVHELGHLLGGRAAGMRALYFIVGPLQVDMTAERWRWQRNRSWSMAGGLALVMPAPSTTRGGMMLMVAGGPLASLLLAVLALALVAVLPGAWSGLSGALAMLSMLIAVMTLVPMRAGLPSDGSQFIGLLKNDPGTRQRLIHVALLGSTTAGTRPRDWDPALVAQLDAGFSDPLTRSSSLWFVAMHAADRGELATADGCWRALAEIVNEADDSVMAPGVRGTWALAIAAWVAMHGNDPATARAWAAAATGAMTDAASRALADAAIAIADGRDTVAATTALDRARQALTASPYAGLRPLMREQLDSLASRLGNVPAHLDAAAAG